MVRRGDDDRVNVFVFKQPLVLVVGLGVCASGFGAQRQVGFVDVTHSSCVGLLVLLEVARQRTAAATGPDGADTDAIVRAKNALR